MRLTFFFVSFLSLRQEEINRYHITNISEREQTDDDRKVEVDSDPVA